MHLDSCFMGHYYLLYLLFNSFIFLKTRKFDLILLLFKLLKLKLTFRFNNEIIRHSIEIHSTQGSDCIIELKNKIKYRYNVFIFKFSKYLQHFALEELDV